MKNKKGKKKKSTNTIKTNKKIKFVKIILAFLILILIFLIACKIIYIYENITFKLKGKDTINLEYKTHYEEPGFIAIVDKKDKSKSVKIKSNINENKLGNYKIQYFLQTKMFGTKKLVRYINVIDSTAPFLNIDSNDDILLNLGENFEMPVFEAIDNVDGNITDKVNVQSSVDTSQEGVYDVVYTVLDSSKNKTVKKITVRVEAKFKNSFIEVSIANQTLNYYEKGELVLTSPIVTGINNGTPRGNYSVLSKSRNVNLKGANYVSHVDYWIAFIGHSYGFHDASWRNSFGGNIYLYNGSHGCVNMPKSKVAELYNIVEIGTPVYIK